MTRADTAKIGISTPCRDLWMTRLHARRFDHAVVVLSSGEPFTRATALAAGVTDWQLRGPAYHRLFTNVYVSATSPVTPTVLARAALLIAPSGTVAARHTAARIWRAIVPDHPDVHLALRPGARMAVTGIDARVRALSAPARRDGIPLTSPADTFVDLAGDLNLVDLVVLGDSLVRRGLLDCDALMATADIAPRRDVRLARRAARLVRAGVDSPMETRLRLLLVLAGLPEPVVNHVIRDDQGNWAFRLDLAYPEVRVAVEYDGRQHAESRAQWVKDVGRREWFDGQGWRIVTVVSDDIYQRPDRTVDRVTAVLRERGVNARVSGVEWQRHFPVRRGA